MTSAITASFLLGLALQVPTDSAAEAPAAAIVYRIEGAVRRAAAESAGTTVGFAEVLAEGEELEVAREAELALAFASGRRFEARGEARLRIGRDWLEARSGQVRELPRVPPLPPLPALVAAEVAGTRTAVVVVRGEGITGLSPADAQTALADLTVLSFQPLPRAAVYRVEVRDESGREVWAEETNSARVEVPARLLEPGRRYLWQVEGVDALGVVARGRAELSTLPAAAAAALGGLCAFLVAAPGQESLALVLAVAKALNLAEAEAAAARGVSVKAVEPGSAAERAGLRAGDELLGFELLSRDSPGLVLARGRISSPLDVAQLLVEEAPRGVLVFTGTRGGRASAWSLPPARDWGLAVAPSPPGRDGDWEALARAEDLAAAQRFAEADLAFEELACRLAERPALGTAAHVLRAWARVLERRGERDRQRAVLERAVGLGPGAGLVLGQALSFAALGRLVGRQGDLTRAGSLLEDALAIQSALAPESLETAATLGNLGIVSRKLGALGRAEALLEEAESIDRRLAPDSKEHGQDLINLANLAADLGRRSEAARLGRQAVAALEKADPGGADLAGALTNLARDLYYAGDLRSAEGRLRRAQEIEGKLGSTPGVSAETWLLSGAIATDRRDYEAAAGYQRQALAAALRQGAPVALLAIIHGNMGATAAGARDLETSRHHLGLALELQRQAGVDPTATATMLANLAELELAAGADLTRAERLLVEARKLLATHAAGGPEHAGTLVLEARALSRLGRRGEARAAAREGLLMWRALAGPPAEVAGALEALGRIELEAGQRARARHHFCEAIDELDQQRDLLGGALESRSLFEAATGELYFQCLDALVQAGEPARAFAVLERSRARVLLRLVAEEGLAAAALGGELTAERQRIHEGYDRAEAALRALRPGTERAEIERWQHALRVLRDDAAALAARVRATSPDFALLRYPAPLELPAVRKALARGTVLLAFAVGEEHSDLFIVTPAGSRAAGLSVVQLQASRAELADRVGRLRRLASDPRTRPDLLRREAAELYGRLLAPASAALQGAERLLIAADGPLRALPFAVLVRGERYLAEMVPFSMIDSATVEVERRRRSAAAPTAALLPLVAFGDPEYAAAADAGLEIALSPLPATRREVEEVAATAPGGLVLVGSAATEERAKSLSPKARILHFATHGLFDDQMPLNSGLALSTPAGPAEGGDNGLLQAWEIFDSLRLSADLVTLSACDTALGKDMGGEGMLGLTRAFQFAGARSVLAALWNVEDGSTAELMRRFYTHANAGEAKAEALRAAQLEMIRGGDPKLSHPFFWAGFQLYGDWR